MNSLLNKMERKLGKYAINNLSLYIIIGYVIGYVLMLTGSVEFISLNPYYICKGQVWRLITWILVPPSQFNLFTIIMLFFYYSIGTSLERTWGCFRYNLFIFSGMIFTVIGAMGFYLIASANGAASVVTGTIISGSFSTYYINLSIFLAFAATYPNAQVLLMFIIPVRMKWMGYIEVIYLAYMILATRSLSVTIAIVMSLLNFILFFLGTRNYSKINPKEIRRRQQFKKNYSGEFSGFSGSKSQGATSITKHKCAICGRSERDSDVLEFRFCSKCNGNYEYCSDHLFTHEHVK